MTYFCMTNCDNMLIISLKVVLIVTFSSITAMADSEMFQRGGGAGVRGGVIKLQMALSPNAVPL